MKLNVVSWQDVARGVIRYNSAVTQLYRCVLIDLWFHVLTLTRPGLITSLVRQQQMAVLHMLEVLVAYFILNCLLFCISALQPR